MSVRFDADRLEIHGEPEPLADAVYYFKPTGNAEFSASANGTVTYRAPFGGESLTWVDRTGHRTGALPVTGDFSSVRLSRDGASVVAALADPRIGTTDLWLYGARRETATRLTFSAGYEDVPTLTPDGARLFYSSDALGVPDIFVKQIGSAEDDRPFLVAPGAQYPLDVSPDGQWLVYVATDLLLQMVSRHPHRIPVPARLVRVQGSGSGGRRDWPRLTSATPSLLSTLGRIHP